MSAPVLGMVLKGYPRISETFISNEIRLLEELGFRIHIFSMRRPREDFSHESVKRISARVAYLPEDLFSGLPRLFWRNISCAFRRPGRYFRAFGLALSRFRGAPKKHTWLKHFLQAAYLAEKSSGLCIAHLHAHFAHTPASVAMYAAILLGLDFSFTAHAKDIYTQPPQRLAEKVRRAGFVFTCTRANEARLRSLAGGQGDIHCVYHGIDLALFSGNGRPLEARPPYEILTVCRFVEKKGRPRCSRPEAPQGPGLRLPLPSGGQRP